MKAILSKENSSVRVVVDSADTGLFIVAVEYLRKNEKVRETVFACSYGAYSMKNLLGGKIGIKFCVTVPLNS